MDINWAGLIIASIVYMIIGAIWYSPRVFGKEWMELTNVKIQENQEVWKMYIGAFLTALLMAFVLEKVMNYAGATDVVSGGFVGFWMWLGFVVTTLFSSNIWEHRPWKLFFINAACMFVTLIFMGGIIGYFA